MMTTKMFFALVLLLCVNMSFGQVSPKWERWNGLIGKWEGEGGGQPGQGGGIFSFLPDLDESILIRKSHTEFPATGNKSATVHEDLMVIYPEENGTPSKAIYFDNEGHIIDYSLSYTGKSIIFTSNKTANSPVFRLIYTLLDDKTVNVRFELSQDGDNFTTYIEGNCKKIN